MLRVIIDILVGAFVNAFVGGFVNAFVNAFVGGFDRSQAKRRARGMAWWVAVPALIGVLGMAAPAVHAQSGADATLDLEQVRAYLRAPAPEERDTTLVYVVLTGADPIRLARVQVGATIMMQGAGDNQVYARLLPDATGQLAVPVPAAGEATALTLVLTLDDAKRVLAFDLTELPDLAAGATLFPAPTSPPDAAAVQAITPAGTGGYVVQTSNDPGGPVYVWNDIAATGTAVSGLSDENFVGPFAIGFGFPFFDQVYSSFYIASNGFIGFGPTSGYSSGYWGNFPSSSSPNNLIGWLLADLHRRSGTVHYQQLADRLVVQFTDYGWYSSAYTGETITAQVHLLAAGDILIYYKEHSAGAPVESGWIGIENVTGLDGVTAAASEPLVAPMMAVRFAPDRATFVPARAQIGTAAGETVTHTLRLYAPSPATEPVNFALELTPDVWPVTTTLTETGPITPGGFISIPVVVTVPSGVGAQGLDRTLLHAEAVGSATPYSATAHLMTCVPSCYDLRVTKRSESEWIPGGLVSYAIRVENTGGETVQGATLVDTLPAEIGAGLPAVGSQTNLQNLGIQFNGFAPVRSGNELRFDLGEIVPGGYGDFTVSFRVPQTSTTGIPQVNTVTISNTSGEVYPDDNFDQVSLIGSDGTPNLWASLYQSDGYLVPGAEATFTFEWGNENGFVRNGVYTATLPAPMTIVTYSHWANLGGSTFVNPFPVTVDGQQLQWTLGNLPPNSWGYGTVVVQLDESYLGPAPMQAGVQADNDLNGFDNFFEQTFTIAPPQADMSVETYTSGSALEGGLASFSVNWRNEGTGPAESVLVTATLPADTTLYDVDGYQYTPSYTGEVPPPMVVGNQMVWELGEVQAGWYGYYTLQLALGESLSAGEVVTFTTAVSPGATETALDNNTHSIGSTVQTPGSTDLSVSKSLIDSLVVGSEAIYRIYYGNQTSIPAAGVVITDRLPVDVSLVTARWLPSNSSSLARPITPTITPSGNPGVEGDLLTFDLVQIPGQYNTGYYGHVELTVAVGGAAGVNKTNRAGIQASMDFNAANNLAQVSGTTATPTYDLGVSASRLDPPVIGYAMRYRASMQNGGNAPMSGVVMTVTLPAGTSWVTARDVYSSQLVTPTQVGTNGSGRQVLTWAIGMMPRSGQSGSSLQYELTVAVNGSVNPGDPQVFEVEAWGDQIELPNNWANYATALSNAEAPVRDLQLTKSFDESQEVLDGLDVWFYLGVSNEGNLAASNLVVTDTLPAGLTLAYVYYPTGWSYSQNGDDLVFMRSSLAAGASSYIEIHATVDGGLSTGQTLVNVATLRSDLVEDNLANNDSSATATVDEIRHELSVSKWIDNVENSYLAGSRVTWAIYYENSGNVAESQVVVTDTLPAGMTYDPTYANWDAGGWTRTVEGNTVTWTRPTLEPYSWGSYLYVSGVISPDVATGQVMTNTAHLTALDLPVEEATSTFMVQGPTLEVNPTILDLGVGYVGYPLSAALEVSNYGAGVLQISDLSSSTPVMSFVPMTLTVQPWQTQLLTVSLTLPPTATVTGAITGFVEIVSNATITPVLVTFRAEINHPALIRVDPAALEPAQRVGVARPLAVELYNDGTAALDWSAYVRTRDVELAAGPDVLLLYSADGASVLEGALEGFGGLGQVDTFDAYYDTPTLAELQAYDVVVVWNYYGYNNGTLLGDTLADYVDGGGRVVVTYWALDPSYTPGGRWASGDYVPLTVGYYLGSTGCLATYDVNDPLFAGVSTALCDSQRGGGTGLATDGLQLALYDDGELLAAANSDRSVLAINAYPGNAYSYAGELPRLVHNSVLYVAASMWATVEPAAGSVAPGTSAPLTLTVDSTELLGGVYGADLVLNGNDPRGATLVPITLTVTGDPAARMVTDTLAFGEVFVGGAATLSATLYNDGNGVLNALAATASDPAVSVQLPSGAVPALGSRAVAVTVAPATLGALNASVVITTDDPITPVFTLAVSAVGVAPPVVGVTPTAVDVSAGAAVTASVPLTIDNAGAYTLAWTLDWTLAEEAGPNSGSFYGPYQVRTSLDPQGPAYEWIDIGSTGTLVTGLSDDNVVGPFPIGFAFPYFETAPTSFYVASNGFIGFGPSTNYGSRFGTTLPNASTPNNLIAWYWRDMIASGSTVRYQTVGDKLVVQFDNYRWYNSPYTVTAQIWLAQDGDIRVQYRDFSSGAPATNAVIGLENGDGSEGLTASTSTSFVQRQFAVQFSRRIEWLAVTPGSGQTSPGGESAVTAQIDTSGLGAGDFAATLAVASNDPAAPVVHVPISLTVAAEPRLGFGAAQTQLGEVHAGYPLTVGVTVSNTGNAPLTVSGFGVDDQGGSDVGRVVPGSFVVAPFGAVDATVIYTPSTVGPFTVTVTATSDDPVTPDAAVTLLGEATPAPLLNISPNIFNVTQNTGQVTTRTLTLTNSGSGALAFSLSRTNGIVELTPLTGTVAPGSQTVVSVTIDTTTRSNPFYSGIIEISSNDPLRPLLQVPVNLNVTLVPPDAPTTPSPAAGEINVRVDKTLIWQGSSSATSYELYLWRDGEPKPGAPTVSGLSWNQYQPTQPLETGQVYHWQVAARNVMGATSGPEWSFTTELLPDLVVDDLQMPPNGTSGQTFGLQFLVRNVGDRATQGAWNSRAWLSASPEFDQGTAIYLGSYEGVYLGPDSSFLFNVNTVALPQGLAGDFYVFVGADDTNSQREPDEENNRVRTVGMIAIEIAPSPDLEVVSVTGQPNGFSGTWTNVQWRVENNGNATAYVAPKPWYNDPGGWTDYVYLSADATYQFTDTLIGSRVYTPGLTTGAGYNASLSVRLPNGIGGDYYFLVRTDINDRVYEHAGDGNNVGVAAAPIAVTLSPPPDFEVVDVQASPTPSASGQQINLYWEVENPGPGNPFNYSWEDRIYLSTSASFSTTNATLLRTVGRYDVLNLGESYSDTVSLVLPNGIQGTYYLHVWTDAAGQVFEYDDGNNMMSIGPFAIALAPSPDLQIGSAAVPTTTVVPGQKMVVAWDGINGGTAAAISGWNDAVYLSTGPNWSPSSRQLATRFQPGGLNVSASYPATSTIIIPGTTELGSYYLHVRVDYGNGVYEFNGETNNTYAIGPITVVSPAGDEVHRNDLVTELVHAPATAATLETVSVTWTVTNTGYGTMSNASGSWYDGVYLSFDPTWSSGDLLVAEVLHYGALEPGEPYTAEATFQINQMIEGDYYWIVVADHEADVWDGNRANNWDAGGAAAAITLSPPPDLVIEAQSPPAVAVAGQATELGWLVRNQGGSAYPGNYRVDVYLSYDTDYDPPAYYFDAEGYYVPRYQLGDYRLVSSNESPLGAGEFYTATQFTNAMPEGLSGNWHLLYMVNSRAVIYNWTGYLGEAGALGNNVVAVPITLQQAEPSDLVVADVQGSTDATAGSPISVSWQLENQGETEIAAIWRDVVFLSADAVWDPYDVRLGERVIDTRSAPLAPGEPLSLTLQAIMPTAQQFASLTTNAPGVTPGAYHYIVRTDLYNYVVEIDEENNIGVSAGALGMDLPVITLGEAITGTSAEGQLYYRLPITTATAVRITVDSAAENDATQVYVRYGQMANAAVHEYRHHDPASPDQTVLIPLARPGDYYIALQNSSPAWRRSPLAVSILAEPLTFSVLGSTPSQVGNAGRSTLYIEGAQFTGETEFELVGPGGQVLPAVSVFYEDSSYVYATFDLTGAALGQYDIRARLRNGLTTLRGDALTVVGGTGPELVVNIQGPLSVRPSQNYLFFITYANKGDADAVAPLLALHNPNDYLVGLDLADLQTGTLQVMGIGRRGPAGILRAGEAHSIPVFFRSKSISPQFSLQVITPDDSTVIDWDALAPSVRPTDIPVEVWNAGWPVFRARLGDTWGDYTLALAETATHLARRGQRTFVVDELFTALFRQAFGYENAVIAGQAFDLATGQFVVGETVTARAEVSGTGGLDYTIVQAVTDEQGHFVIEDLPAGTYELLFDNYLVNEVGTVSYTVDAQTDVLGLQLAVYPIPEDAELPPGNVVYESPELLDVAGTAHLVYVRNGQLYHAVHDGSGWGMASPITGAMGREPRFLYDPTLIDGTDPGLALFYRAESDSGTAIHYVIARQDGGSWEWSEPGVYVDSTVADLNPNVIVDANGVPLVLWQSMNIDNIEDDTDLYYDHAPVQSSDLTWADLAGVLVLDEPQMVGDMSLDEGTVVGLGEDGTAYVLGDTSVLPQAFVVNVNKSFEFEKKGTVPKFIPYIGGKNEVSFSGALKGSVSTAGGGSASGSLNGAVSMMQERVSGSVGGEVSASWGFDTKVCKFKFEQASLSGSVGLSGDFPIPSLTSKISLGDYVIHHEEVGINVGGELSGILLWKRESGKWPDGSIKGSVTLGIYGFIKVADGAGMAKVSGSGNAIAVIDAGEFTLKDAYLEFKAELKGGPFEEDFSVRYPPEGPDTSAQSLEAMLSLAVASGYTTRTVTLDQKVGTGAVYSGTAVLGTVAGDYVDDGAPALVRDASGLIHAIWTREPEPSSVALGNRLFHATYDGANWSAPVEIPGTLAFNGAVEAQLDADGDLLVVWSRGDATGFTRSSDAALAYAASVNTDLWYATYAAGTWSTPQSLSTLSGPERWAHLSTAADGSVWALWVNQGSDFDNALYAATWDGAAWGTAQLVASGPIVGAATWLEIGGEPFILWPQAVDDDDGVATSIQATSLYTSRYSSGVWTAAALFQITEYAPLGTAAVDSAGTIDLAETTVNFDINDKPSLAECCPEAVRKRCGCPDQDKATCKPEDPEPNKPDPDGDGQPYDPPVVVSHDPNDILGPVGHGAANWIPADSTLDYTVRFENDPVFASAPAQRVSITKTLDADLDPRSFRLGAFGFGEHLFTVPENTSTYATRLAISSTLTNGVTSTVTSTVAMQVDVTMGIDIVNREAFWIFQTIDPATGAPPLDAAAGFLPPNLTSPEGEGFVSFSVRPKRTVTTGAVVDAQARIIFDDNEAIDTPPIFNTLDADVPSSALQSLGATTAGSEVLLTWDSQDGAQSSGVAGVDIYVAQDGGPFELWQAGLQDGVAAYNAMPGHSYQFFARAADFAGNREPVKLDAEASTLVFIPGEPLALVTEPLTLTLTADGTSQQVITLTVLDGAGQLLPDQVVTVTASLGTVEPVTVATGISGTAQVTYTAPTLTGAAVITAQTGSLSATVPVTLVAGLPAALDLAAAPDTLVADGTSSSSVTATVYDAFGHPVAGQVVTLTGSLGTVAPVSATSDANGTAVFAYTAGLATGVADLAATLAEATGPISATTQITLTAGPPAAVTLAAAQATLVADGAGSTVLTATVADAYDHPLAGQVISFTLGLESAGLGSVTPISATTGADGVATATFTAGTLPGSVTVAATVAAVPSISADVALTLTAGAPVSLTLETVPDTLIADGASRGVVTATVVDAFANPVSGQVVSFTTDLGTVSAPAAVTGIDGRAAVTLTAGTGAGEATVGAQVVDVTPELTATTTVTFTAGPAAVLGVQVSPTYLAAGAATPAQVTATVQDAFANPVAGQVITFSASLGSLDPLTATAGIDGRATVSYRAGTLAAVDQLTATVQVDAGGTLTTITSTTSITVVAAAPISLTLTHAGGTLSAGSENSRTLTATVFDAYGNPTGGQVVRFATDLGTLDVMSATTGADGTATTALRSVLAGTATVSATLVDGLDDPIATAITTVVVVDEPIAGLAIVHDGPVELGEPVDFTATITAGSNVTYTWDLGDGAVGAGANVTHTYGAIGVYSVTLVAQNTFGVVTTTATVEVRDVPVDGLNAVNDGPVDLGASVGLTAAISAGSNVAYTWDLGDGSVGAGATVTHTYDAVGTYTATVTAVNSRGSVSETTLVTVRDLPITGLAASNDGPVALGTDAHFSATVTGGSNVLYTWAFGDGTIAAGATVTHTYGATGIYTATVTALNGRGSMSATTTVDVHDVAISGLVASSDGPTPIGSATAFSATLGAGTNVTYTWAFGDGAVGTGATVLHTYGAVGVYTATVTATNSIGSVAATTTVAVHEVPIAGLVIVHDGPVDLGDSLRLTATITAGTNVTYTWDLGDGTVSSGPTATHGYTATGSYSVTLQAQNSFGVVTTTATVAVRDVPVGGLNAVNDGPVDLGASVGLTAAISAGSNVAYTWDLGDGSVGAGAHVTHTYGAVGTYTATVTAVNSRGSVSETTLVTVRDLPITGLAASNDGPVALGTDVHFSATVTGGSNVLYTWDLGDGTIAAGATVTHTYGATGIYTATVTALNGRGSMSATTTVDVHDVAISGLVASSDGPTPIGSATAFSVTLGAGTNVTYTWAFGDGATGTGAAVLHTYGAVGVYTATVTATNSIGSVAATTTVAVRLVPISGLTAVNDGPTDVGSSTRFTAAVTGGSSVVYTWAFGDGATGSGATPTHTYAAVGDYTATVTATNGLGSFSTTTAVSVRDTLITGLSASNDGPVDLGESVGFAATVTGGSNVTYAWAFGDGETGSGATPTHSYAGPGVYTATVTATNGRGSESAITTVVVRDVAIAELTASNDSPTDLGGSTRFTAAVAAGTNVVYRWDFGDGAAGSGATPTHTYGAAGVYTATVTATNNRSRVDATTTVVVRDLPITGLAASNDGPTDLGGSTSLAATVTGGSNVVYSWDFGDGETGSGAAPTHVYTGVGVYTATVTATNGRGSESATTAVVVRDVAITGLSASNDSPTELGSSTSFAAVVTGGSNVVYAWDFGDGDTGSGATPTHTYGAAGVYTATVTATNGRGSESATTTAVVQAEPVPTGQTVTGMVFVDENGNGIQDEGEPGVADAEVTLEDEAARAAVNTSADPSADTVASTADPQEVIQRTFTDARGVYTFTDVLEGVYQLTVVLPEGYAADGPMTVELTVGPVDPDDPSPEPTPGPMVKVRRSEYTIFLPSLLTPDAAASEQAAVQNVEAESEASGVAAGHLLYLPSLYGIAGE